jgi:hypothetical protein
MNDQIKATKACPFCGEEILAVAIKCKHCSEMLSKRERNNDQESKSRVTVRSLEVQNYCCPSCLEIIPADTISCFNCGANSLDDREWQPVQSVKFDSKKKDETVTTQLTSKTMKSNSLDYREWQPVQSVKFDSKKKDETVTTQLTSKTMKSNSLDDREWQPVQSVKFDSKKKDETVTTQLTSKTIKLNYLISIGIALLGFLIPNPLGYFILSIAAIWLAVTWFFEWWDHG